MASNTVYSEAARLGVYVATWNPGDGATRYRFFENGVRVNFTGELIADYNQGLELFTALGRKHALTWLRGYSAGRSRAMS